MQFDREFITFPELSEDELGSLPADTRIVRLFPHQNGDRFEYDYMCTNLKPSKVVDELAHQECGVTFQKVDQLGVHIVLDLGGEVLLDHSWLGNWITVEKLYSYLCDLTERKTIEIAKQRSVIDHSLQRDPLTDRQLQAIAMEVVKRLYAKTKDEDEERFWADALPEIYNEICQNAHSDPERNGPQTLLNISPQNGGNLRVILYSRVVCFIEKPLSSGFFHITLEELERGDLPVPWGNDCSLREDQWKSLSELTLPAKPIARRRHITERDLGKRVVQVEGKSGQFRRKIGEKLLALEGGYMRLASCKEPVLCDDSWILVEERLDRRKRQILSQEEQQELSWGLRVVTGISLPQRQELATVAAQCILNSAGLDKECFAALYNSLLADLCSAFADPLQFCYEGLIIEGAQSLQKANLNAQNPLSEDYLLHLRVSKFESVHNQLTLKMVEWSGATQRVVGAYQLTAYIVSQEVLLSNDEEDQINATILSVEEGQWRRLAYEIAKAIFVQQQQGIQTSSEQERESIVLHATGIVLEQLLKQSNLLYRGVFFRAGLLLELIPRALIQVDRIDRGYFIELKIDMEAMSERAELAFIMSELPGDRSVLHKRTITLSELTTEIPAAVKLISVSGFNNSCGPFALAVGVQRAVKRGASGHQIPAQILNMEESLLVDYGQDPLLLAKCDDLVREELVQAIREDETYQSAQRERFRAYAADVFQGRELPNEMDSFKAAMGRFCEELRRDLEVIYGAPLDLGMLEREFEITLAELILSALDDERWNRIFNSHCNLIQSGQLMIPGDILGVLAKRWHINLSIRLSILQPPYFSTEKQEGWPLVELCNPSEQHWLVIVPNS